MTWTMTTPVNWFPILYRVAVAGEIREVIPVGCGPKPKKPPKKG